MKNIVFFIVFFSCLMLIDSSCKKENSNSTSNPTVAVLYEKSVDPAASDVTVELPNKISIVIPQGVVPNGTVLKISELASNIPKTNSKSEYQLLNGFTVELGSIKTFSKPLRISFPIPDNYLNDPLKRKRLRGAYFSPGGVWTYYPDTLIDLVKKTFSFDTKHLTPLGFVDFMLSGLFTNYYSTQHYTIYYTFSGSHGVMSDVDYNLNAQRPWHVNGIPDYVSDAGYYLEYADSVYRKVKGLELPASNNIYIKNTGGDGYYSAFSGCVNLSNTIQIDVEFAGKVSKEQYLAMACAHELFHLAQDYFYGTTVAGRFNMWWMEALATNADRIVYPPSTGIFESMMYSKKNTNVLGSVSSVLHYNLSRSWDDCNVDPAWYVSGCFLFYMQNYRPGTKLDIVKLMKSAGKASFSSYSTLLNEEIESQLSSTIYTEYVEYVKFLYGNTQQYFNLINPIYVSTDEAASPCFEKFVFASGSTTKTTSYYIPYLSTKIVKFNNPNDSLNDELDLTVTRNSGVMDVFLCDYKTHTILKQVFSGDKLILDYKKNVWNDLIMICSDVNGQANITLNAEKKNKAGQIVTTAVSDITTTTASSGGNIKSDGGKPIIERGVCWNTFPNPVATGWHTSDGSGIGTFTSSITGLSANTTYYVRAYTKNSTSNVYGNEISFTTAKSGLAIGDSYQGGLIAYILKPGDIGYIDGEVHGLIYGGTISNYAKWGDTTATVTTSTSLGSGASNTLAIVTKDQTSGIAARLCNDLVKAGYSDWYLPSIDELNKVWTNLQIVMASADYWSSSQYDIKKAYSQRYSSQSNSWKFYGYSVCAMRSF